MKSNKAPMAISRSQQVHNKKKKQLRLMFLLLLTSVVLIFVNRCDSKLPSANDIVISNKIPSMPPSWTMRANWYQIMVERFYNGDPSNDPTKDSIQGSYPGVVPPSWTVTKWTQDWYQPDNYFSELDSERDFYGNLIDNFDAKTALRRYGGDLQGVIQKLDYLKDLGVNAIYLNPINDSPSLHKYDARHWRHVDVHFGPDPEADKALIAQEDPLDPSTWNMTSADRLFLELIKQAKERGFRVILDYSWNHTGIQFWAWQDLIENQAESEFANWYWVNQFDDPATSENEFSYKAWLGVKSLPEIKETLAIDHSQKVSLSEGNIYSEEAKQHIFDVSYRWLDPNKDGDFSDGVDGFRLDVAAEMPLGFWREYRQFVKTINPDAALIGEIWWEVFPHQLMDPSPVLQGDVFDSVMNYRWYKSARALFAQSAIKGDVNPQQKIETFVTQQSTFLQGQKHSFNAAMMNIAASHDTPRLLSSLYNENVYKFQAKASQDPTYKLDKPNQQTYERAKLLLTYQYTALGSPHIWAGDEMGMWGSDDPNNRKPLIWPELNFADEQHHPLDIARARNEVKFNQTHFNFLRSLLHLRNSSPVLATGNMNFLLADDDKGLLVYERKQTSPDVSAALVVFNLSPATREYTLPSEWYQSQAWRIWKTQSPVTVDMVPSEHLVVRPMSATVILR